MRPLPGDIGDGDEAVSMLLIESERGVYISSSDICRDRAWRLDGIMDRDVHAPNDMCVPNENLGLSFRVVVGLGSQVQAWDTDGSLLLNRMGSDIMAAHLIACYERQVRS